MKVVNNVNVNDKIQLFKVFFYLTSSFRAVGSCQGQLPSHTWRICLLRMFWVSRRETGAAENPYRHGGMMLSDRTTVYFSPSRIFAGLTLATERFGPESVEIS